MFFILASVCCYADGTLDDFLIENPIYKKSPKDLISKNPIFIWGVEKPSLIDEFENSKRLDKCIKEARVLHRKSIVNSIESGKYEYSSLGNGFIKSHIDYNILTFRPIPCIDPYFSKEIEERDDGARPAPMPMPLPKYGKFEKEIKQIDIYEELKISMLDQCLSTKERLTSCQDFKELASAKTNQADGSIKNNLSREGKILKGEVDSFESFGVGVLGQ